MPQPWGLTQGKWAPLAVGRAGGTQRRAMGSLNFACEQCACAGLLLKQGGEGSLKTAEMAAWLPVTAPVHATAWARQTRQPRLLYTNNELS